MSAPKLNKPIPNTSSTAPRVKLISSPLPKEVPGRSAKMYTIKVIGKAETKASRIFSHNTFKKTTCLIRSIYSIPHNPLSAKGEFYMTGNIYFSKEACSHNGYSSGQNFPFTVAFAVFTADIVFILQRFHNALDGCNGFSGCFHKLLLFHRRVLCNQFQNRKFF